MVVGPMIHLLKNKTETLMKKSLVVVAALFPIAQAAYAEGLSVNIGSTAVTLYGTLDIGIWTQSKSTSDESGPAPGPDSAGRLTKFHTGGISPSKWGLTGVKDLGNGIKGMFKLEEHIKSNTGDTEAFGISGFVRETYVGVQGDFGKVLVGRQFTPAILAYAATDPRGLRESLSGMNSWLASGNTGNTFLSAFASNSISYGVNLGNTHLAAMYAIGGKAGDVDADSTFSIGATYAGPVTVSGSYERENRRDNGDKGIVKSSIGIGVPVGQFVFKLNHMNSAVYDEFGEKANDYKVTGAGVDWKATERNTVNLSYYRGKDNEVSGNKAGTWVVGNEFAWDKSTTLYAQAAFINAKANADAVVSLLGNGTIVQDAKTYVINAGIRYNF